MCADIYAEVFGDKVPAIHGRSGQGQGGVDLFVEDGETGKRIAIQCKRYDATKITEEKLQAELVKLDKSGVNVSLYVIASTLERDISLRKVVLKISDARVEMGLCRVHIDFWQDLCDHIGRIDSLQRLYAPHLRGGILHEVREQQALSLDQTARIKASVDALSAGSQVKDVHGRYLLNAWRRYVRPTPIGNARKLQRFFGVLGACAFAASMSSFFLSSFRYPGYWFTFVVAFPSMLLFAFLHQLRQERLSFALPFLHRELLLEVNERDDIFVTRIGATCPYCASAMRFRFLGDWRHYVVPWLVCSRNRSAHRVDLDHTTLPEPGTDISE